MPHLFVFWTIFSVLFVFELCNWDPSVLVYLQPPFPPQLCSPDILPSCYLYLWLIPIHCCMKFHCMNTFQFTYYLLIGVKLSGNPKWSWEAMKREPSHMYHSSQLTLHTPARRKIFSLPSNSPANEKIQLPRQWETVLTQLFLSSNELLFKIAPPSFFLFSIKEYLFSLFFGFACGSP